MSYEGWTNERLDDVLSTSPHNLKRIGNVKMWNTKLTVKCLNCGHEWEVTPYNLKQGTGCPECARAKQLGSSRKPKYTTREVVEMLAKEGLTLLDTRYLNATTPMRLMCKNGHLFERTLMSFLKGYTKCPLCRQDMH